MDTVFKEHSQKIYIYMATETILDPYEKNVALNNLNPLPLNAIVTDLVSSQIQWKMPGIMTEKGKEIIIEKKHRTLLEKSHKIQIVGDSDLYEGWKVYGRMQIREEQNYLRCYIYVKKT